MSNPESHGDHRPSLSPEDIARIERLDQMATAAVRAAVQHPAWKEGGDRILVLLDDGDPEGALGRAGYGHEGPGQVIADLVVALKSAGAEVGAHVVVAPGNPGSLN